jgi:hypothetical protein
MLGLGGSQLGQQQAAQRQAQSMIAATQPALSQYTTAGPTGVTPFRQQLTNQMTSSANAAYNNAAQNVRRNALQMGLQNQPLQLGNQSGVEAQRAQTLARVPGEAAETAAPLELQAIQQQTGQAGLENQIGQGYNPLGYYGQGVGMEAARQNALNQQYLQQQQANAALWQGLLRAGTSFIPGVGLARAASRFMPPAGGGYTGAYSGWGDESG